MPAVLRAHREWADAYLARIAAAPAQAPLLSGLSAEARRALEAATAPARPLLANADLFKEGNVADALFVLTNGWACRYLTTRNGARQIVGLLVPGDVANVDVLTLGRADFGVRALTAASVVPIARARLRKLAEDHAGIAAALQRLTLVESASLRRSVLCLGRMSAQQRVAHLLCELAVRLVGDGPSAISYALPLTQEQIADVSG